MLLSNLLNDELGEENNLESCLLLFWAPCLLPFRAKFLWFAGRCRNLPIFVRNQIRTTTQPPAWCETMTKVTIQCFLVLLLVVVP